MVNNLDDGNLPQDPVFVVGYPRSGTTLLQALLATQGNIVTFPETHFFNTLRLQYGSTPKIIHCDSVGRFLENITKASGVEFVEHDIALLEGSEWISTKELFEYIVKRFLPDDIPDDFRWLEKTPDHAFSMEVMQKYYPKAKFVGIVRHPFPAIFSRTRNFRPKVQDPIKYLARQWALYVQSLEEFKQEHPEKIFIVKYEDLAQSPQIVVSSITDFLSVDFDPGAFPQRVEKAHMIIKPFEHWKAEVASPTIKNNNGKVDELFSVSDTLKIQSIVQNQMRRFDYAEKWSILQPFYRLFYLQLPAFLKGITTMKNSSPRR